MTRARCVLRFRCPDQPGILATVTSLLAANGWDIREAAIYGDPDSGVFFVRTELASDAAAVADLPRHLAPAIAALGLDWEVHDIAQPMPVLIAVSKFNHCLIDLIHKVEIGALPIRIVGVVSNHDQERGYVRRVSHATTAEEMVAIGREVEASVLSRAVRWHAEHRVIGNGNQTVVLT